jgi:hypothetical protein
VDWDIRFIFLILFKKMNGDWGLGIGDWGLGIGDWGWVSYDSRYLIIFYIIKKILIISSEMFLISLERKYFFYK